MPPKIDPIGRGENIRVLGQGSFGRVDLYRMPDGKQYAVKLAEVDPPETFSYSSLRETVTTKMLQGHPNIIKLYETGFVKTQNKNEDYMVLELANMDLKKYITSVLPSSTSAALIKKSLIYQMCCAVDFCLSNDVLHRDLKPQNMMIFTPPATSPDGLPVLKLADFGLARTLGCVHGTGMTKEVVTMWYRAPELLLGGKYGHGLDKWSVGCIAYEILTGNAMFPGDGDLDMLFRIFRRFGYPGTVYDSLPEWQADLFPRYDKPILLSDIETDHGKEIAEILLPLFAYVPEARPSLRSIYRKPYFASVVGEPKGIEDYPEASCFDNLEKRSGEIVDLRVALSSQPDINANMIKVLIGWMLEVSIFFAFSPRTYFYTVDILLEYIAELSNANKQIPRTRLQLIGISSLVVSSMMNEIMSPPLSDYVQASANTYSAEKIAETSRYIIERLEFDLIHSTCVDFYTIFAGFYPFTEHDLAIGITIMYLVSVSKLDLYTKYSKMLALSVILLQTTAKNIPFKHSQHLAEIMPCYDSIIEELTIPEQVKDHVISQRRRTIIEDMREKARKTPIKI